LNAHFALNLYQSNPILKCAADFGILEVIFVLAYFGKQLMKMVEFILVLQVFLHDKLTLLD
jgi:hypothetical protein